MCIRDRLGASRLGEARLGGERIVPTPSAVYGVSEYGQANYTQNNVQDALIAETAIKAGHVLITDDRDLQTVTTQFGGRCLSVAELMAELGSP